MADLRRAGAVRLIDIRDHPLSVDEVRAAIADADAGGTAIFVGTVRADDGGRAVTSLSYEAHPDAARAMREVADEVAARHQVIALAAVHRVGLLAIGDLAVVVAVSSAHRAAAFAACEELIDKVKEKVPIWKRQSYADGSVGWPGIEATLEASDD
jgi:molybdopterin synthase catalytic subunit